jgi:hypothetical protein
MLTITVPLQLQLPAFAGRGLSRHLQKHHRDGLCEGEQKLRRTAFNPGRSVQHDVDFLRRISQGEGQYSLMGQLTYRDS